MASSDVSGIDARLVAARWVLAAGGITIGTAGGLFFGYLALIGFVASNVVYIVLLAPILFAFWQLTRWGLSKYVRRKAPPFYARASIGLRALMGAFLAGLARLSLDLARLDAGTDLSGTDGLYALLSVLIGASIGAGGAAYNNVQHRRRSPVVGTSAT